MKRTPLKRGRPKAKPSMAGFWAAVTANGNCLCELCHRGAPFVRVDAHHFIPKQRLPTTAKADERVGVCLCRDCHDAVEWKRIQCPRPPLLDEFLADHGLLESGRPVPKGRAA